MKKSSEIYNEIIDLLRKFIPGERAILIGLLVMDFEQAIINESIELLREDAYADAN
jgi:hypothetical protein